MWFTTEWAAAFALTLAVEAALVLALPLVRGRVLMGDVLVLNLVSQPLAWQAVATETASFSAVEVAVIAFEALGYAVLARLGWRRALLVSTLANGATILLGILWGLFLR